MPTWHRWETFRFEQMKSCHPLSRTMQGPCFTGTASPNQTGIFYNEEFHLPNITDAAEMAVEAYMTYILISIHLSVS